MKTECILIESRKVILFEFLTRELLRFPAFHLIHAKAFLHREPEPVAMIFIVWLLFQVNAGSPISTLPGKLRLYQQRTGIYDFKLNKVFEQYLEGESPGPSILDSIV